MMGTRLVDRRAQRGQGAVEFVFALTIVIALATLLFQALFFELDVFNQSAIGRYQMFKKLHTNEQPELDQEEVSEQVAGKPLSEITGFKVLFQPDSDTVGDLKWGPRRFYARRGTQAFDPLGDGIIAIYAGILLLDHYESTAGMLTDILGSLNDVIGGLTP